MNTYPTGKYGNNRNRRDIYKLLVATFAVREDMRRLLKKCLWTLVMICRMMIRIILMTSILIIKPVSLHGRTHPTG